MTSVSIQLPDNAEPGDTLTFSVNGQTLEIVVPVGSQSGDVLEIQVGGDDPAEMEAEEGAEEEEGPISIQLSSGKEIVLHGELPNGETTSDEDNSDGTHAMAWPAGLALVKYLNGTESHKLIRERKSHSVLEVGSGLGLAGLAFAHFLSCASPETPAQVVLTDVPSALPLLLNNIDQNRHIVSQQVQVTAVPLVWHTSPVPSTTSSPNFLIGSDLLYNHDTIPALIATTRRLLTASTRILVAVRWRKPELERSFFSQLDDLVDWSMVDGVCPLSWNEYGDPQCEASNLFFSQTMVGVEGVPTALAEIDEAAMGRMEGAEFEAFERMYIQIYVGNPKEN
jgi:predicted nicotinamide N-methyase